MAFIGSFFKELTGAVADIVDEVVKVPAKVAGAAVGLVDKKSGDYVEGIIKAPVGMVTDTVRATGRAADGAVKGDFAEVGRALGEIGTRIVTAPLLVTTGVRVYKDTLCGRADRNGWETLPRDLVNILREHYAIDFSRIRYATRIDTEHGQAITLDHDIFFPSKINLKDYSDLHWMLHELEHVRQFEVSPGFETFLVRYGLDGLMHRGRHDDMTLEKEADDKANSIIRSVYERYVGDAAHSMGRH